ncbi:MAG TPA: hypothetical protein PK573_17420 [Spirochaetota bacterium]|nr:hypothetical protein [Spirochaetota bacterium]HRZ28917.1 hypothetical protein [Spirochaetota bacterium]HSA16611.1 hypothetical protein [Spirochaetota bacterium]
MASGEKTKEFRLTGGARFGMMNASWPFASLKVDGERLEISASIMGRYVFRPGDIVSIEPYGIIPVIGRGIRIKHRVKNYREKVIFWSFKKPEDVIGEIGNTGFVYGPASAGMAPGPDPEMAAERRRKSGFPVKVPYAVAVVVIWNMLFAFDFIRSAGTGMENMKPGIGVISALVFLLLASALLLVSERFGRLVMKKGRDIGEIKSFLYFIILVSAFMIMSFTCMFRFSN